MAVPPALKPWLTFLKKFRKAHPHMDGRLVMKKASIEWRKLHGKKTTRRKPRKTPVRRRRTTTTTVRRRTTKSSSRRPLKYYPNGRPYKRGAAWRRDHYMHNKNEPWEIPRRARVTPVWN